MQRKFATTTTTTSSSSPMTQQINDFLYESSSDELNTLEELSEELYGKHGKLRQLDESNEDGDNDVLNGDGDGDNDDNVLNGDGDGDNDDNVLNDLDQHVDGDGDNDISYEKALGMLYIYIYILLCFKFLDLFFIGNNQEICICF